MYLMILGWSRGFMSSTSLRHFSLSFWSDISKIWVMKGVLWFFWWRKGLCFGFRHGKQMRICLIRWIWWICIRWGSPQLYHLYCSFKSSICYKFEKIWNSYNLHHYSIPINFKYINIPLIFNYHADSEAKVGQANLVLFHGRLGGKSPQK